MHTQRWTEALSERGLEVTLVSQEPPGNWTPPARVAFHLLPFRGHLGYFANAPALRAILRRVRPDVLSAHYASGYGTLAALLRYRPTLLSVWGSDVFVFPRQSWLAGRLVRWNLRRAHRIASTSRAMEAQVRSLVPEIGRIEVTPFGVDVDRFQPRKGIRDEAVVTVGTVKTMDHDYGIDFLLRAFARLVADPALEATGLAARLRLLLVGGGPERENLEKLAGDLGIADRTTFQGRVPHGDVSGWLNRLDVYVAASRSESFGVAVLEASACGLPVVVSDVGGLPEVVQHGRTGWVTPRGDVAALHESIRSLVVDPGLRRDLGEAGREFVRREYAWSACVDRMIAAYGSVARDFPAA